MGCPQNSYGELMDIAGIVKNMYTPILAIIKNFSLTVFFFVLAFVFLFFLFFFCVYCINPFTMTADRLRAVPIKFKPYDFLRWILVDGFTRSDRKDVFQEYGFTIYCGRQGAGKTLSLVQYLIRKKAEYPKCKIVTNFNCSVADYVMKDWRDFLEIRNGTDGVIFAIDEIQNEYNADNWKDFPEDLLSEISMQRKQRIKIVATSQVFSRVAKPIREQTFSVVICRTFFGRLVSTREYDAAEYGTGDTPYTVKKRCKPINRVLYIASDELHQSYDTYEKIERMSKTVFIPRSERGVL